MSADGAIKAPHLEFFNGYRYRDAVFSHSNFRLDRWVKEIIASNWRIGILDPMFERIGVVRMQLQPARILIALAAVRARFCFRTRVGDADDGNTVDKRLNRSNVTIENTARRALRQLKPNAFR